MSRKRRRQANAQAGAAAKAAANAQQDAADLAEIEDVQSWRPERRLIGFMCTALLGAVFAAAVAYIVAMAQIEETAPPMVLYQAPSLSGMAGTSEDALQQIDALRTAGVQVVVGSDNPQQDASWWKSIVRGKGIGVLEREANRSQHDIDMQLAVLSSDVAQAGMAKRGCAATHIRIHNSGHEYLTPDLSYQYNIARTVFEVNSVAEHWLDSYKQFDELWIPSEFHRLVLLDAGFEPDRVHVIPEVVQPDLFVLPQRGNQATDDSSTFATVHQALWEQAATIRERHLVQGDALFLSVFAWDVRKGWKTLLKAFAEEFPELASEGQDQQGRSATLLLKIQPRKLSSKDDLMPVAKELRKFFKAEMGFDEARIPRNIQLYRGSQDDTVLSAVEYAALFHAADAFVLPTHGEGWCRPCHEAMLSGTPTLVTGWSGVTQYLTNDTGFPLDFNLTMVPNAVTDHPSMAKFELREWAQPSFDHLRASMRWMVDRGFVADPEIREITTRGQQFVQETLSKEVVGRQMVDRLHNISHSLAFDDSLEAIATELRAVLSSVTLTAPNYRPQQGNLSDSILQVVRDTITKSPLFDVGDTPCPVWKHTLYANIRTTKAWIDRIADALLHAAASSSSNDTAPLPPYGTVLRRPDKSLFQLKTEHHRKTEQLLLEARVAAVRQGVLESVPLFKQLLESIMPHAHTLQVQAHTAYANALTTKEEHLKEALANYLLALSINDLAGRAHRGAAGIYLKWNYLADAEHHLSACLEMDPNDRVAQKNQQLLRRLQREAAAGSVDA